MWAVSLGVAGILIAAYAYCCGWKIFKHAQEIKRVSNAQDLVADVKESNLLKPLWTAFEKTLTTVGDKTYSTIDAAEFFNPQSLTRGLNMTFWQSYGGIFTGLGILGTFMGLTAGLSGVDMTSGDIEALKSGIAKLLSGVESAFVTSLVGIGCAIIYSVVHHWLMKNFQGNLQTLAEKLDEKFPRRSAEDWLGDINGTTANHFAEAQLQTELFKKIDAVTADNYTESQEQTTVLKNIGEQVAEAIHNALDEKLAEYVESICAAIDKLGTGASEGLNDTISKVAGAQMDRFSAALDKFSDKAETIMANAQEVSQIMNERLLDTLEKLDDSLKKHAESSAAERAAAYKEFLSTLESLTNTLNEVADKIKANGELVNQQANADRENHKKQTQAANQEFLSTLAALTKTLQAVVDNFKDRQTETLDGFTSLVTMLIDDLDKFNRRQQAFMDKFANSNAAQISEAVKAFSDIITRHNATTKDMFDKVQKLLHETETYLEFMDSASATIKQAADPVKQSTLQLTKNLTETAAQMNNLADANRSTRENLSDLTARLKDFVTNFNSIANELDRSTKIIKDSLENYNYKISDGLRDALTKFDTNMTKALADFNELVDDFSDMVGYVKQRRR